MSKIAEKKVMELGHSKDPFSREEFTANDIFDACVECYDQAIQDFLEKAEEWLKENASKYIDIKDGALIFKKTLMMDFKNHMENEM